MSLKIKPCTVGAKHCWTHVKDVTVKSGRMHPNGGVSMTYSAKGLYKCACGERKYSRSISGSIS